MTPSLAYYISKQTTAIQVLVDIYSTDYSNNPRAIKPIDLNSTIDLSFKGLTITNVASASL